jgi:hypothetical protein
VKQIEETAFNVAKRKVHIYTTLTFLALNVGPYVYAKGIRKVRYVLQLKICIDNRKENEYVGCSTHLYQHFYLVTFEIEVFIVT